MNFSLTPKLEQFIRDCAASGDYNNASEVVREALRLLQRQEEERVIKLERLRATIKVGEQEIENGNYTVYGEDNLDKMFEDAGW